MTATEHPSPTVTWSTWLKQKTLAYRGRYAGTNQVKLLVDAEAFVPTMLDMIAKAEQSVAYQFFGIEADEGGYPFAKALLAARRRDVHVKVIYDALEVFIRTNGRWSFFPWGRDAEITRERKETRALLQHLQDQGIDMFGYPWRFGLHRNHTKSLIVDGHSLCIGGFNPTAHNLAWHEVCALVTGPIAQQALEEFNMTFELSGRSGFATRQSSLPVSSDGISCEAALFGNRPRDHHFGLTRLILDALDRAQNSIWLENGYVGHRLIFEKLLAARARGVNVQLIVPAQSNHRSVDQRFRRWMGALLAAGVEVHLYQGMTHAKIMVVDEVFNMIGSANFESFSLRMNNELNLVALDPSHVLSTQIWNRVFAPDIDKSNSVQAKTKNFILRSRQSA